MKALFLLLAISMAAAQDDYDHDYWEDFSSVAFNAARTVPIGPVLDDIGEKIYYDLVTENTENWFNPSTSAFVAPESGLYWFSSHHASINTTAVVRAVWNGEVKASCGTGMGTCAIERLLHMTAGDTISMWLDSEFQGVLDCHDMFNCQFSGFLLPGSDPEMTPAPQEAEEVTEDGGSEPPQPTLTPAP